MGFITHYRGYLRDYEGKFDESMLLHEVTVEDYLAERYPSVLLENYPRQAWADREMERGELRATMMPNDSLWLWRRVDFRDRTDGSSREWGGLAQMRAGKVIRVWLVWTDD
jgi:hypothetical protein